LREQLENSWGNSDRLEFLENLVDQFSLLQLQVNRLRRDVRDLDDTQGHLVEEVADLGLDFMALDHRQEDMESGLSSLNSERVTRDYFYSNESQFQLKYHCFDTLPVSAGEVFDFNMNISTQGFNFAVAPDQRQFYFTLEKKGGLAVANARYLTAGEGFRSAQLSIVYQEKMEEDTEFWLCSRPDASVKDAFV
jgi:regulator of replication initiation timing